MIRAVWSGPKLKRTENVATGSPQDESVLYAGLWPVVLDALPN